MAGNFSRTRFNGLDFSSTSTYTPQNWAENNANILNQSTKSNIQSAVNRVQTDHEDRTTRAKIAEEQERSRLALVARVHDINNWQRKLEHEIDLARVELGRMTKCRERVYKSLDATEIPMQIVQDNLNTRNRRVETDMVIDNVEVQMGLEKDHILKKQQLLEKLHLDCENMEAQLNKCIENLNADWSDKKIANAADTHAGNLHNRSNYISGDHDMTNAEAHKTVSLWRERCLENITASGTTRQNSSKLRDYAASLIQNQCMLSRKHNDTVNRALQQRIYETITQKRNLEVKLSETEAEFHKAEQNNCRINTALKDIIPPMQVNLTRRRHRNTERPEVQENLHDQPEVQLVRERTNLNMSQQMMVNRLEESQRVLKELQDRKDWLKKELRIKTQSLEIDQNEVVPRRAAFPSESILMGY